MTLEPLTCPNCGGAVNRGRLICEFCGTQFNKNCGEIGILKIEHVDPNTRVLRTKVQISREQLMITPESVESYAKSEIAKDMARQLLEGNMIEMVSEMDWKTCGQVISARLRVLDPHFRY